MTQIRVLLVDDDPSLRAGVADALEHAGIDVTVASRLDDANDLIEDEAFDLLVTDINLEIPLAGLELVGRWRRLHPDAPIVFATSYDRAQVRARQLGPDDGYLMKPFHPAELVGLVHYVIRKHGRRIASGSPAVPNYAVPNNALADTSPWIY